MTGGALLPGFGLEGRTALVTGAGQGLGRAIALRLARAGASVGVNDLAPDTADHVVAEIELGGGRAVALPGDIANPGAVDAMFAAVDAKLGRLDILVNNAGIVDHDRIDETDFDQWNRVLAVNLGGPMLCARAAIRRMRGDARGGRIVMIGSVVGHQGALRGWPGYGASKAGLHGLAKTLARSAAPEGITVNVVAPGVIRTEMLQRSHGESGVAELAAAVPLRRLGEGEDVAAAVHFLASDAAAYITGAVIDVNGGLYVRA